MRWHKATIGGLLVVIGIVLAGANIWVVAARSTIPLAIDSQVLDLELRREKHPGKDDVCLIYLRDGRTLHVDKPVYTSIDVGDTLRKSAWSRELTCDNRAISLQWSADFKGMVAAMPAILAMMLLTAVLVARY